MPKCRVVAGVLVAGLVVGGAWSAPARADVAPPATKPAILTRQLALTFTPQTLNGKPFASPGSIVVPINVVAVGSRFTFVGRFAPKVLGVASEGGVLRAGFADGSLILDGKGNFGSRVEGTFRMAPSSKEVYVGSFAIEGARFEAGVGVRGGMSANGVGSWGDAGLTSGWNTGGPSNWNRSDGLFSGHEKAKLGGGLAGWASEDDSNSVSGGGGGGGEGGKNDAALAKWKAKTDALGCPPGQTCTGTAGTDSVKTPTKPEDKPWYTRAWESVKTKLGIAAKTPVDDLGRGGGGTGTLVPLGGGVRPGGGDPNPNGSGSGAGGQSGANGSYVAFKPMGGDDPFEKTVADALNINRLHDPSSDPLFAKISAFRASAN